MIRHTDLAAEELRIKIKRSEVTLAGNSILKIYGTLKCGSGKRMNNENRVFFSSKDEAINAGYRPCGHCMKMDYQQWKKCS